MVVSLVEGQTISAKYSLLHRIAENDFADCWLAVDADLNERVFLKIFKGIITSQEVELISANIERQRGLLHGNITRTYEFEQVGEISFLASQYIQSAKTFSSEGEFSSQWTQLKQVADALEFAHSLGFAHGHLHPDNILVDSENKVSLTDFSYGSPENDQNSAYLSPQIRSNHPVDASDDIYSLGQLLFKSLTGDTFRDGQEFESNLPIPAEFQQLLTSMLHQSPYDRPLDIDMIKAVVDGFATGANDTIDIAATSFNRAAPAPVEVSSEGDHRLPRDINTVSTNKALIGLGVLVVVALAIFAFIPDSEPDISITPPPVVTHSKPAQTTETESVADTIAPPLEVARLKKLQEKSAEIAQSLLRVQNDVEDIGAQIWASDEYDAGVELGMAGDEAFRYKDYELAVDKYQQGLTLLESVLGNVDSVFDKNLQLGTKALEDGDADLALEAFAILSAIKNSDRQISAGLERAVNLKEVLGLVRDGEVMERNGSLTDALGNFKLAVNLDRLWRPATDAVARVRNQIAKNAFNDQMSIAYDALERKDYDSARQAFNDASKILPGSGAPAGGLQEIVIAETQDKITTHKDLSYQHILDEKWSEAIVQYEAILSLSPGTTYAVDALEVARNRLSIDEEIQHYIASPGLMIADDELKKAKAILLKAARIKSPGPKLKDNINQLSHSVSLARIPIEVDLKSDNKTDVTMYQIGNFGKFDHKSLELYPGTYTIVGKRRKYRDVQQEITLLGGHPAPTVLIACVEKVN